jgi:hypothetical protein
MMTAGMSWISLAERMLGGHTGPRQPSFGGPKLRIYGAGGPSVLPIAGITITGAGFRNTATNALSGFPGSKSPAATLCVLFAKVPMASRTFGELVSTIMPLPFTADRYVPAPELLVPLDRLTT